jgi:uncharacterized membrane protein
LALLAKPLAPKCLGASFLGEKIMSLLNFYSLLIASIVVGVVAIFAGFKSESAQEERDEKRIELLGKLFFAMKANP